MKKVELLAPVGNMNCLKAAVEAGCDAVYLGGVMFGARAFAGDFNNDEMIEAINYSHLYGVKVYVTINTIVYEKEVDNFVNYVRFLHKNNVDAVIVQDIGMFDLLRKKFPNLELHASTQMHIHNYEGAVLAHKLGFKRIVMARETPLGVIEKIKKNINIEVEVFAHGALCVSYSGQCLLSTLIGHRSGNRGTCAQICRKKFSLYDENKKEIISNKYLLSTKDLCTLNYLDRIIKSGVDSLKIEGRMKRPEYVYLVTKIYRKIIDNYYLNGKLKISQKDILDLQKIFNRCFTKGFMMGEENDNFTYDERPNHKGIEIGKVISKVNNNLKIKLTDSIGIHDGIRIIDDKEDKGIVINKMFIDNKPVEKAHKGDYITIKYDGFVKVGSTVLLTTDSNQINEIDEKIKSKERKVLIDCYVEAKKNKKLLIKVTDGLNEVTLKSNNLIEKSINKPTNKENIIKQMSKTGDTMYKIRNIDVFMDNDVFINIKDINELRRKVLEALNKKRLYSISFIEKDYHFNVNDYDDLKTNSILINNKEEYEKIKNDSYDVIYTNDKSLADDKIIYKVPRIVNKYDEINNKVLIGELGSILKYKKFNTDFSFNVVNSYSVCMLHELGAEVVTLSYELTLSQIKNIVYEYKKRYNKNPNLEVIINSYPEAMISKFDLAKKYKIKKGYLKDSYGKYYKIKSDTDYMTVYNYEKVNLYDKEDLYKIGINKIRINL